MLKEDFQLFCDSYVVDKGIYKNSTGAKKLSQLTSAKLILKKLPQELKAASNLNNKFQFTGSVGKGNIADIPHLCVFDTEITNSAQQGYYIVYLFSSDLSNIYLSLNQGWTQYEKTYGIKKGKKQLIKNTQLAQHLLRSIDPFSLSAINLKAKNDLGKGYQLGNICSKTYSKDNFPSDAELIDDLRNLIGIYRELKGLVGKSILDIEYRRNELDYQSQIQTAEPKKLPEGPITRKERQRNQISNVPQRDTRIAADALVSAHYTCENDETHTTFVSAKSGHPFMEAHHLIPLALTEMFPYSLDVPENIICLCPNCHRAFHNAEIGIKEMLIRKFELPPIFGPLK